MSFPTSNQPNFNMQQDISLLTQTAAASFFLPPSAYITGLMVQNKTANAITGGLKFGTTAGGVDIVAALAIAGSAFGFVTDALMLKRFFSAAAAQQIFYDAVVSWNSASVQIDVMYNQL